jgi:hypothetical protein
MSVWWLLQRLQVLAVYVHNSSSHQMWIYAHSCATNVYNAFCNNARRYMIKDKARNNYLMALDIWTPPLAKGFNTRYCSI